jgi:nicotinamidase-related amidase
MTIAVLVIDIQSALIDPEPRPFDVKNVLSNINTVTNWARTVEYPVIYVQHEKIESVMEYESKGWQLQSSLNVIEGDIVVRKTTPDSFLRTNLENILETNKVKHLIVTGYASEFCVDTTVRRAASLGYSVELVSDAHTTHCKEHASGEQIRLHHNCTLPEVTSFGVKISAIKTSALVKLV